MSAWTNKICILYWNLHCTMYCTLKFTHKKCTHKSKCLALVWLTYSTRNIPFLATCKFDLTLDSILSWKLYCILYFTLYCMLYTVSYTILFSNAKVAGWNALIPKEHASSYLPLLQWYWPMYCTMFLTLKCRMRCTAIFAFVCKLFFFILYMCCALYCVLFCTLNCLCFVHYAVYCTTQ